MNTIVFFSKVRKVEDEKNHFLIYTEREREIRFLMDRLLVVICKKITLPDIKIYNYTR